MKKQDGKQLLLVGFTLFSMFFGAGNLIFPPGLGAQAGIHTWPAMAGMAISAVGLPVLGVVAVARSGGLDALGGRVHPLFARVFTVAAYLAIGPCLAIPRTASTSFEMAVPPFVGPDAPLELLRLLFSLAFFTGALLVALRPEKLTDRLGKVLCPILIALIVVTFVGCLLNPLEGYGPPQTASYETHPVIAGFLAGYQTMDVLAAIVFGYIILKSAREKGHTTPGAQLRVVSGASLVAGIGLLVVYLGLTYLGATTARFFDITVDRTFLVVSIVRNLLGQAGIILFAVVVALACVTTAVGLVSACADYFSGLSGGRVSYRTLVCVICVFSAVVSNFGLNEIIAIASPILSVVYPPTLVLIVLALFGSRIRRDWVFRLAALGALAVSLLEVVRTYTGVELAFLDLLPLASLDFGWVLPAAVCGAVGALIPGGRTAAS